MDDSEFRKFRISVLFVSNCSSQRFVVSSQKQNQERLFVRTQSRLEPETPQTKEAQHYNASKIITVVSIVLATSEEKCTCR